MPSWTLTRDGQCFSSYPQFKAISPLSRDCMAPSISGKCLAISLTILVHQIHAIALIPDDMLVTYPNDATMKFTWVPGTEQLGAIRLKRTVPPTPVSPKATAHEAARKVRSKTACRTFAACLGPTITYASPWIRSHCQHVKHQDDRPKHRLVRP